MNAEDQITRDLIIELKTKITLMPERINERIDHMGDIFKLNLSQLKDEVVAYHIVQTELKNELERIKNELAETKEQLKELRNWKTAIRLQLAGIAGVAGSILGIITTTIINIFIK